MSPPLRRQASRAAEPYRTPSQHDPFQEDIARKGPVAEAIQQRALQRSGEPARVEVRHGTILRTSARAIRSRSSKRDRDPADRRRYLEANPAAGQFQDHAILIPQMHAADAA